MKRFTIALLVLAIIFAGCSRPRYYRSVPVYQPGTYITPQPYYPSGWPRPVVVIHVHHHYSGHGVPIVVVHHYGRRHGW